MTVRTLALLVALLLGACAKEAPPADDKGMTIRGTVSQGVEAGCTVLSADGEQYLLIGALGELPESGQVVLRGRVDRDQVSFCQQGVPFVVTEILEIISTPPTP